MKKLVVVATFLALAGANLPTAKSGDWGWTNAGTIPAGIAPLNSQPAHYPVASAQGTPVTLDPRPLFITPQPLVNVNSGYGRGHAHAYGR